MKTDVIIIGGGGYATEIIGVVERMNVFNILGYTDLQKSKKIKNTKYLGDDTNIDTIINKTDLAILGIGQEQDSTLKKKLVEKYKKSNFKFQKIIGNSSTIDENANIGEGTVVRENCFISSDTIIGKFSTISDGASISYNTKIGDYCNISLGVNIGINVNIGNNVLIGIGSTILNGVTIEDNCLIGAGALVIRNCKKNCVYFGSPAKKYDSVKK
jgi:sugar O-acyltransferase (sialic acid O-acetyltransferase NeuD family)